MTSSGEPLYLTYQLPDGTEESHEVNGPPGVFRFAVGSHTRRSSVWRVWTNRSAADYYVGVRSITGVQKYSFHQSGQRHLAFSDAEKATHYTGAPDRFIEKWDRPDQAFAGWTRALAVRVPHGALSDVPGEADDDEVLWLLEAPEGRTAVIGIGVVEPNRGTVDLRGLPVAGFRLASVDAVIALYMTEPFTDETRQRITDKLSHLPFPDGASATDMAVMDERAEGLRVGLFGSNDQGSRFVWDLPVRTITVNEAAAQAED